MGNWITVTDTEAMAADSPERLAIAKIKRVDDLAELLQESVAAFRDAIQSGGQFLGPEGTVPPGLKQYVLDRAIWMFVSRGVAQNKLFQTDARKSAAARAETILDKIMSGDLKVIADNPAQTISHGVSVVRPGRHVRTDSFDKLGSS